jgi:uncharacterized protein (TIGR00288 family)
MSPKKPRVELFIDGSNFYHSLREHKQLPFNYDDLFARLSELFEIRMIHYYDATKDSGKDPYGYSKQQTFHSMLKKLKWPITIRTRKLKYLVNVTPEQVNEVADRVGIQSRCKAKLIELLRGLNLIRLTKEKGIDVMLVVDSIEVARKGDLDAVILLTGDADFTPAVELIQSLKVRVINLHTYKGSSNELRSKCDEHILINFGLEGFSLVRGRR